MEDKDKLKDLEREVQGLYRKIDDSFFELHVFLLICAFIKFIVALFNFICRFI